MQSEQTLAVQRYGLGARPGERARTGAQPRQWLLDQLVGPDPAAARWQALPGHVELWARALQVRADDPDPQHKTTQAFMRRMVQREAAERCALGVCTARPFAERWARFWCRHFAVSARKSRIEALAGAFEREAVRPRVFGSFEELLQAAVTHPAMLIYLDNDRSIGPRSPVGRKRGKGLNENLAREVLELHTLGVDGGYSQADVEALAAVLTGWGAPAPTPERVQSWGTLPATATRFLPRRHEPGPKRLLGQELAAGGAEELAAALSALAHHPATARHLARKLAVHFVADDPPAAVVQALEQRFVETQGDLAAVARLLVEHDGIWQAAARPEHRKLRPPQELLIAMGRALGLENTDRESILLDGAAPSGDWALLLTNRSKALGQLDFRPPSPAGWPDTATAWSGPDQLVRRVELAGRLGRYGARRVEDPVAWATDVLGPLDPALAAALADAPDRATAAALVLASPAFQWS